MTIGLVDKIMTSPLALKWIQEPGALVEKLIHPDTVLAASGAILLTGSALLFLSSKLRARELLDSFDLNKILKKIEFQMYYPGCLAFTTAILNLQKEMEYDAIDPL